MEKGFDSYISDSQTVFRKVLDAMANPGMAMELGVGIFPPECLCPAAGAILMTLLDFETPLWSNLHHDSKELQWLKFHTGAPFTHLRQNASFALCTDCEDIGDLDLFNRGTIESPQLSTTLIVQVKGIDGGESLRLTGPGIQTQTFLKLTGLKDQFFEKRARIYKAYPLGVDMIFVWGTILVAIPRTTRVEIL